VKLWPVSIVALFAAGSARADMLPLQPGADYARPTYRIETEELLPDYVFVVARHVFRQSTPDITYVELGPGHPLTLTTGYQEEPELFIVPRNAASEFPNAADLVRAVREGRVTGSLQKRFPFRALVPSWSDKEILITYRLKKAASGNGLELVRTSRDPMWQWYLVVGLFTLAVVSSGIWFIRRQWSRRSVRMPA
jgi:hypothetical protein